MKPTTIYYFAIIGFIQCLCIGQLRAETTAFTTPAITTVIAFGDSYSDGGSSAELSSAQISTAVMAMLSVPKDASYLPANHDNFYFKNGAGRWSNGKTAVEVLADTLKATLVNYAVGGAKTDNGNYYRWMDAQTHSGLQAQIERWMAKSVGADNALSNYSTLFFIFISANDYFQAQDDYADANSGKTLSADRVIQLADQAVVNIHAALTQLSQHGAGRFMLVNSTDLSIVPWEQFYHRSEDAAIFVQRINQSLLTDSMLWQQQLNVKISLFDHAAFTHKIRNFPAQYGFTQLTKPCRFTWLPDQATALSQATCSNPEQYYFWDEWHPTKMVHQLVGNAMAEQVLNDK